MRKNRQIKCRREFDLEIKMSDEFEKLGGCCCLIEVVNGFPIDNIYSKFSQFTSTKHFAAADH